MLNINKNIINEKNIQKIEALKNPHINKIIEEFVAILKPEKVTVIDDSQEDIDYIRELSIINKEETKLATKGHTIHYDGYYDQGRDKKNTRVLVTPEMKMSKVIDTIERDNGLKEVLSILDGSMKGKECIIRFFCLGPVGSRFALPALQVTDSAYVAHSEDILYRKGYEQFKNLNGSDDFIYFIHSAGELDERNVTKNIDKRRIYVDLKAKRVLTVNNQYAGNSLGLKKLGFRLAINKANHEDWLAEHMFLMGVKQVNGTRISYFTGAFPSACGKTSTAMIPGQTIVGDDIVFIRKDSEGYARVVNSEQGIFGIIADVNPEDDPVIYKTLTTPRELIFTNVLVKDGIPYWLNMGKELPNEGINHYGQWKLGMTDKEGKKIDPAHKNARYTVRIEDLENADALLHDKNGVLLDAVIYGGRDSDTSVPVYQSLNWDHGVFIGACLESETTFATLGGEGKREFNPMANLDFLVVPLSRYIQNHMNFGNGLKKIPSIFATNYFLRENDKFLNSKLDKKIWLLWMEKRIHNEYDAIETPVGYIPEYKDLNNLFKQVFNKEYREEDYNKQFALRIAKWLAKMERIKNLYDEEDDIPETFYKIIDSQLNRLLKAKEQYKKDIVLPYELK